MLYESLSTVDCNDPVASKGLNRSRLSGTSAIERHGKFSAVEAHWHFPRLQLSERLNLLRTSFERRRVMITEHFHP